MNQPADDLPDDLPVGVVETYRELLKDCWEPDDRDAKCLRRLIADPEMTPIYRRLNAHFDGDADLIGLFVRETYLAATTAEHYYVDKPEREEFNRRRQRAIVAANELAEQIAYLSDLWRGGLSLTISRNKLESVGNSATQIADALSKQNSVNDFWREQSSGTAPTAVFVRALEKYLHGVDGLSGLNMGSGERLLSYADMATVTRVALNLPRTPENGTRFDVAHVREALKSFRRQ